MADVFLQSRANLSIVETFFCNIFSSFLACFIDRQCVRLSATALKIVTKINFFCAKFLAKREFKHFYSTCCIKIIVLRCCV